MAKPKIDFKDLMLRKGEYIALGVAGFGLVVLLLWGITTGAGAANPAEISKEFVSKAKQINDRIADPNDSSTVDPLHESLRPGKTNPYLPIEPDNFASTATLFDMVGRPDIKRENPKVYGIEEYQPDLVRGAMPGFDIVYAEGKEPLIAVRVEKKIDKANADKFKDAISKLKDRTGKGADARRKMNNPPASPPGSLGPQPGAGGAGGAPGPGQPPKSGSGSGSSLGPQPGAGGSGGGPPPLGGTGFGNSGFDSGAQRMEVAISYIPLDQLDDAVGNGKLPAQTVIPLRLVVVNFTIPLKQQMEEVKRALRLQSLDVAKTLITYDGFEVQRRITQRRSTGEEFVIQDWAKYDYESKYMDLIFSRKLKDHIEGSDKTNRQGQYLPYFYKYEDSLVMPLPELVSELGSYPPITLKAITDTIEKLIAASTPKVDPSSMLNRLQKKGSRHVMFNPNGEGDTGGDLFKPGDQPKTPAPGGGKGGNIENQAVVDIDYLLGRFVDCDVQPGLSYEYRIQLRMLNPNFGDKNLPYVSNPVDTKKPILFSPWVPLNRVMTVPAEDFLFASDRNQYHADTAAAYKDAAQKPLLNALQVKDGQAVVQAVKWMESIRMEGKHEPVGGWVVAEMPVSRGEYVGKKTFVKLPLWSSERNEYVFREIPAGAVKGPNQPKGWLVDFSSKSILLDFEGGKSSTRMANGRTLPTEESSTEMLIVRADGKLIVRRSAEDAEDQTRKDYAGMWKSWLDKVETRPAAATGTGENNPFDRPK